MVGKSILGIGIDIEEISRFSDKQFEGNKKFYSRIFSDEEIKYCLSFNDPYPHFTARFCAKEASIKALKKKIGIKKIQIKNINHKPYIQFSGDILGDVSLSHSKEYAVAVVIIYER